MWIQSNRSSYWLCTNLPHQKSQNTSSFLKILDSKKFWTWLHPHFLSRLPSYRPLMLWNPPRRNWIMVLLLIWYGICKLTLAVLNLILRIPKPNWNHFIDVFHQLSSTAIPRQTWSHRPFLSPIAFLGDCTRQLRRLLTHAWVGPGTKALLCIKPHSRTPWMNFVRRSNDLLPLFAQTLPILPQNLSSLEIMRSGLAVVFFFFLSFLCRALHTHTHKKKIVFFLLLFMQHLWFWWWDVVIFCWYWSVWVPFCSFLLLVIN